MNRKGSVFTNLLLILLMVTVIIVMITASMIRSNIQTLINIMYENIIEVIILLALLAAIPIILYIAIERKKKVFYFFVLADAILIALIVSLFSFPYLYAMATSQYVSAKIGVNIVIPATIAGQVMPPILTGYKFSYVQLYGYYPNTAFGSVPLNSIFNGNTIFTVAEAYCQENGQEKLVSSGTVASVFPSFTLGYTQLVNVTVPNIPVNDICVFKVYLTNSNGEMLTSPFYTASTQVSLNAPAQTFWTSSPPIVLIAG